MKKPTTTLLLTPIHDDALLESVSGGMLLTGRLSSNVEDMREKIDTPGAFARYDRGLDALYEAFNFKYD